MAKDAGLQGLPDVSRYQGTIGGARQIQLQSRYLAAFFGACLGGEDIGEAIESVKGFPEVSIGLV